MEDLTAVQNAIIDDSLVNFESAMSLAGRIAWDDLEPYLAETETQLNGKVFRSVYNEQVGETQIPMSHYLGYDSVNYDDGVEDLKIGLDAIWQVTFEHYSSEYGELQQAYLSMTKGLVTTMKKDIDAAFSYESFQKEVTDPCFNAYFQHLNNGSTFDATYQDIHFRTQDRFNTFGTTKSLTLMQQFTRRLNQIFNDYYQLVWCKYVGPKDDRVRDFCRRRMDEQAYYHVEEVKEWPQLYSPWDGEIPNTDRGSIFVNCGGYNCRHNIEYVAAGVVPDNLKQQANAKGYKIS